MFKILGISGSPRIAGNTEILIGEALRVAREEGAETEQINLSTLEIKPCIACLSCRVTKECAQKDDFPIVFEKMIAADGLLLGTPVYFSSATPQIMSLIGRAGYVSGARGRILENKVGAPLVVARRAGHNFTFAQLIFFFFQQGMIIPGSTYWNIAFGREKGEVLNDEEGLKTIRNTARKMVWLINKIKDKKE